MKRKYSWRPDLPDHRDHAFVPALSTTPLPTKVDLRTMFSTIYDQGQLGSCFHPDTQIPLLNGESVSIKELCSRGDFYVYSIDENHKIVPGKATAHLTGVNKKIIKLTLDSGSEIICTPEHQFMLRDGSYKEAKDLLITDSLMPLYRKHNKNGYEMCFSNYDNKYHTTHSIVAYNLHEEHISYIDEKVKCVHHKDFNKLNNDPENLVFMGLHEHWMYHANLANLGFRNWNGTDKQKEHSKRVITQQYLNNPNWNTGAASKAGKAARSAAAADPQKYQNMTSGLEIGRKDPIVREKARKSLKELCNTPEHKVKMQEASLKLWNDPEFKNKHIETLQKTGKKLSETSVKNKIILWAKDILSANKNIDEESWFARKQKGGNVVKFKTIFKYFENVNELKIAIDNYNHKIIKIEDVVETSDVYCLTVEKYHNFAIDAGVFVHNCTSNAIAMAYDFERINQHQAALNPSRLFIYYNERLLEGTVNYDAGAYIRDGIKTVNQQGVAPESDWPYLISKFRQRPPTISYTHALTHKVSQYLRLDNTVLNNLKSCLAAGFGFVFGFTVYASFESNAVTNTGIVPMPQPGDYVLGGHACFCLGYDDAHQWFIVRNSWGPNWGDHGHFYIPYSYLTNSNLASDFWTIRVV